MKKIYVRPVSEFYEAEMGEMICASNRVFGYTSDPNSPFNVEKPQPTGDDTPVTILTEDGGPGSSAKEFDLWGDW
jgi:hypothetical protein